MDTIPKDLLSDFRITRLIKNGQKKERRKKLRDTNPVKSKMSAYLITINTHVGLNKLKTEEEKEKWEEEALSVSQVVDHNIHDFIKFMNKKAKPVPEKVKAIKFYHKKEFQEFNKAKQFHIHTYLQIEHETKLQLNYDKIKRAVKKAFRGNPLYMQYMGGGGELPKDVEVHVQRATDDGRAELEYMEKGTHTIWKRREVREYYKNLRETGAQDPELWNRFERTGTVFIEPPEGYIPGL